MRIVGWFLTILLVVNTTHAQTPAALPAPLPTDVVTHHSLELPNRTIAFSATAGSIRLTDDNGAPQADVAFIAYRSEGADPRNRPVTFVFNGGPGSASGWLQVGAIGPWRVKLGPPSTPPVLLPNAETWLEFTDLVFLDPPGTGYSRVLTADAPARRRLWSVNGDIAALSETIRRWLDRNERHASPHYILGESYGGFRGPRLARRLQSHEGVGVSGLILVSPLLDAHVEGGFYSDPFYWVDRLPSQVAAARGVNGKVERGANGKLERSALAEAENYAADGYLTDLVKGPRDAAAVARIVQRVTALIGFDPAVVRRYGGQFDNDVFLHELRRAQGEVGSVYDATVAIPDPFPRRPNSQYPDPTLDGFAAPVTGAMMAIYAGKLNWRPDAVWHLGSDAVFSAWDWGQGMGQPQSIAALREALALDPKLRVLIAHGMFDLRTPYFTSARIVSQLPDLGAPNRVRLSVYSGGHMFYSDDAARAAFRDDGRGLYAE